MFSLPYQNESVFSIRSLVVCLKLFLHLECWLFCGRFYLVIQKMKLISLKLVSQSVAYLFHAVFVVSSQRSLKSTTNPRVAEISIDNYILPVFNIITWLKLFLQFKKCVISLKICNQTKWVEGFCHEDSHKSWLEKGIFKSLNSFC
jgi:hypothetical protein